MNQIRLDWDDITWDDCRERISQIKEEQLVQSIELRFSPRSGFHTIVSLYVHLPITRIWYLRRLWGDDGNRLCMDVLHHPSYYRDVLFRKKGEWIEQPLFIYTRIGHSNEWRKHINARRSINPRASPQRNRPAFPNQT